MTRIVFNVAPITEALTRSRERLDDMTPVFESIGNYLIGATRERFGRSEAPDGTKWLPKSAVTLARYKARGDGARPHPLIGPSKRLSREIIAYATKANVEVGSNLEYSGVMQDGAAQGAFGRDSRNHPIPWGTIPARRWLGLSANDEVQVIGIAEEYLRPA